MQATKPALHARVTASLVICVAALAALSFPLLASPLGRHPRRVSGVWLFGHGRQTAWLGLRSHPRFTLRSPSLLVGFGPVRFLFYGLSADFVLHCVCHRSPLSISSTVMWLTYAKSIYLTRVVVLRSRSLKHVSFAYCDLFYPYICFPICICVHDPDTRSLFKYCHDCVF